MDRKQTIETIYMIMFREVQPLQDLYSTDAAPWRQAIKRAAENAYTLLERQGLRPDETAMTLVHHAERFVPEIATVTFSERDYGHLVVQPERGATELPAETTMWLDENAPGYSLEADRGDWGEGIAHVSLTFQRRSQAEAFMKRWGIRE